MQKNEKQSFSVEVFEYTNMPFVVSAATSSVKQKFRGFYCRNFLQNL